MGYVRFLDKSNNFKKPTIFASELSLEYLKDTV